LNVLTTQFNKLPNWTVNPIRINVLLNLLINYTD